jgi:hypothetical protein
MQLAIPFRWYSRFAIDNHVLVKLLHQFDCIKRLARGIGFSS